DFAAFRALGATPVSLPQNELYTSLQTHLVDGGLSGLVSTEAFKIYEVTKYVSLVNYSWAPFTFIANADAWQRLPANVQRVTEGHIESARTHSNADYVKLASS